MRCVRTWTRHVRHAIASLFTLILISSPVVAYGQTVTAMWDPSPPSDQVTSYQACIGTTSKSCDVQLASVSNAQTAYTFTPTPGVVHYVAIKATNSVGTGSYSTEASFSIPSFTQPVDRSSPVGVAVTPLNMSVTDPRRECPRLRPHRVAHRPHTQCQRRVRFRHSVSAGTCNVIVFANDSLVLRTRSFVSRSPRPLLIPRAPALSITATRTDRRWRGVGHDLRHGERQRSGGNGVWRDGRRPGVHWWKRDGQRHGVVEPHAHARAGHQRDDSAGDRQQRKQRDAVDHPQLRHRSGLESESHDLNHVGGEFRDDEHDDHDHSNGRRPKRHGRQRRMGADLSHDGIGVLFSRVRHGDLFWRGAGREGQQRLHAHRHGQQRRNGDRDMECAAAHMRCNSQRRLRCRWRVACVTRPMLHADDDRSLEHSRMAMRRRHLRRLGTCHCDRGQAAHPMTTRSR